MTTRDATAMKLEFDAMRRAREADHATCARLTARVQELEEVAWRGEI